MNQPGKYIAYLLFGLFTAVFISSCTDGNEPGEINHPKDKVSLSISFHSAQQTRAENGLRANEGGGIDEEVFERESAIYSLAVMVLKHGSDELDGMKCINREITDIPGAGYRDYRELDEIKEIELTAGIRDVYIIANAPDGHFNDVTDFASFRAKMEDLSNQGMYDHPEGGGTEPDDTPIGGEEPDDRFTNLVMSQSFIGMPINNGAEKHYLGYTGNGGLPEGETTGTPLNGTDPVELVRLVARVAIQKIAFELPPTLTFDPGIPTSSYLPYVDTVFMLNAKTVSSYFPEDDAFPNSEGSFGHGNVTGYNLLKGIFSNIPEESTYADYLYIPINFPDYDIEGGNHVPLWFYAFENANSETSPTGFVIGVKYQYKNTESSELKTKKVYYPIEINSNGQDNGADHDFIKRNNQYGIKVTIKGLGSYITDYPDLRSAALPAMRGVLSDAEEVMEIEETVGSNLFPWTGNVYK